MNENVSDDKPLSASPENEFTPNKASGQPSFWQQFRMRWRQWTRPSPHITSEEAQRRAQLTSAVILLVLPFTFLHVIYQLSLKGDRPTPLVLLTIFLLPLSVTGLYILSRSRYASWAAAGLVTAVTTFPFIILFTEANYSPLNVYNSLVWLLTAVLVGSVLLSFRQAVGQAIIIFAFIISLRWLLPDLPFTEIFLPPLFLLGALSILLLTFRRYMLSLEKEQRQKEKQLYAELQTSERQFRLLFEQAPIGMSISSPDGRFMRVNQAYCETVGYTPVELCGLGFLDITHPDDREANRQLLAPLLRGEIPGFFMEKRYVHKSGHTVYALLQVVLEHDSDGRPARIIGQIMDITERKKIEDERRENQQLLQGLIENSTAVIFVKDLDGHYVLINTPFEEKIRLPRNQILGRTDYDLFPRAIADKLRQNDVAVLQNSKTTQFEEISSDNTNSRNYLTIKFPLFDEENQPYALAGISTDITEQKKTENLLRKQKAQLEALRQVGLEIAAQLDLSTLLQSIIARAVEILNGDKGALWLHDPDQDVLRLVASFNGLLPMGAILERGEGLTGQVWLTGQPLLVNNYAHYSNKIDMVGKSISSLVAAPVIGRDTIQGAISIAQDQPDTFSETDADLLGLFAAQAAIAIENARLHENIQRRSQELARSNQDLQDFAYAASHDLQEPLRKIQTFGDRLQSNYAHQLDERGLDYLQRMQQAAQRMQTLIVDLLAYSRVTTQARPFTSVDLNAVLVGVLTDLDMRLEETRATIQIDHLPTIDADATQMAQLFLNLLSNALKFTHSDRAPSIHIHSRLADRLNTTIFVSDNGIGFEEKYLDRIFGVFQRLHGRQEYSGSGVGLAVCQKIIKRHGGQITATSTPGEGTTFIITLPLHQSTES